MSRTSQLLLDVVTGAAAGWVGQQVKAQGEATLQPWGEKVLPPEPGQKDLLGADPAGQLTRMPPANVYLQLMALRGRHLDRDADEAQIQRGAEVFHQLIGLGAPIVYSVLSRARPGVRTGLGIPASLVLFAAFHGSTLPAAGLQAPLWELPRAWWVWEAGSHVMFGVGTDVTLGLLRRITG